jgi:hypothetical protein
MTTPRFRPAAAFLDIALMVLGVGCAATEAAPLAGEPTACVVRPDVELFPRREGVLAGTTAVQVQLPIDAWDDELVLADVAAYPRDAAPVPGPRLAVAGIPLDDSLDLRDLIGPDDVLTLDVELDAAEATRPRRFDLEICLGTR